MGLVFPYRVMEEITLVKDFAIIMVVAGATTLLFRRLRQPPILGYLLAGLLIGPYALPTPLVTDLHTIGLLADLGLVLLLFGLGLEFSWGRIRHIGLAVLLIGGVEIVTMIFLGYSLGQFLGWSKMDSVFLGAALHISSSAIIVKILRDLGKLDLLSSRIIVGILIVEDFAAVVIITLLSGIATTGTADLADIGSLVLRLVIFVAASLTLGAIIVPRVIRFTHQFRSKEALLITCLGLCFTMALLGRYSGLSVAAGAFLMGSLIGDTKHSEEITELVTPIRDMFGALFFVAIGMLVNIAEFADFIVPGIIVASIFMLGKILSNTLATFISGHDGRTALEVGMGMPQMGEFSLAIAKLGIDRGVIIAPLYPVIAIVTALTSLTAPYITRSSSAVADFFDRRSPTRLKEYASLLADWLQAIRTTYTRDTQVARRVKHSVRNILVNLLLVVVIIGIGTFMLDFVQNLAFLNNIRDDIIGLVFGLLVFILCVPSFVVIWRNLQALGDEVTVYVLRRRRSARLWNREAVRIVLRDSILIVLSIFVLIWFIPFIAGLLSLGSYAVAVPILVLAVILYLLSRSVRGIHSQLERSFSRILLGEESATSVEALPGTGEGRMAMFRHAMNLLLAKMGRRRHTGVADFGKRTETREPRAKGSVDADERADSTSAREEDGSDASRLS